MCSIHVLRLKWVLMSASSIMDQVTLFWWQLPIHFFRDGHTEIGKWKQILVDALSCHYLCSFFPSSAVSPGAGAAVRHGGGEEKVHGTCGIRQQVKIVYYRTGFIVEALPHIKYRHWTTALESQPPLGLRTEACQPHYRHSTVINVTYIC